MGQAYPSSFSQGLGSLFDLAGVYGSFLVTSTGDVAARALPEVVEDATLTEVGGRVIRLGDTFSSTGLSPDLCVLRFADHKLYIKTLPSGALCILTGSDVSLPALRMAANLVARKVSPDLDRIASTPASFAPPSSLGLAAASNGAPTGTSPERGGAEAAGPPPSRMYRGRPMS